MFRKVRIDVPTEEAAEYCRRHHIRKLMLFGLVVRDDFGSTSDMDVPVEFAPNRVPGYLGLDAIEQELSRLLDNRAVDIVTTNRRAEVDVPPRASATWSDLPAGLRVLPTSRTRAGQGVRPSPRCERRADLCEI